jgi:hypothetical protein
MLKFLKSVAIRFNPADPTATSARELLQRVGSASARKSNPDCDVSFRVLEGRAPPSAATATTAAAGGGNGGGSGGNGGNGGATVALEFSDGERRELRARDYTVADFVKVIEEKATAMELKQVLTECKFDPEAAAAAEEAERQARRRRR